jgi:hypothetical protein
LPLQNKHKKRDRMRCNSKRSKSESIDNISMLVF